jgi:hypothetical protein
MKSVVGSRGIVSLIFNFDIDSNELSPHIGGYTWEKLKYPLSRSEGGWICSRSNLDILERVGSLVPAGNQLTVSTHVAFSLIPYIVLFRQSELDNDICRLVLQITQKHVQRTTRVAVSITAWILLMVVISVPATQVLSSLQTTERSA